MKYLLQLGLLAMIATTKMQAQDLDLIGYIDIDTKRIKKTKIKSIKEESDCYIEQEKPPYKFEDCEKTYKEKYDKNGNLISLKIYEENTLESTTTYIYENNKIVSVTEDDGEDVLKKIYRYNKAGKLLEKKEYENKTLEISTTFSYNEKGLLAESIYKQLNSEGFGSIPYQKTIYEYNADGKCTYEGIYDQLNREKSISIYEYSNNGLTVIKKEKYDGAFVKRFMKTKDTRGNLLETILYDLQGNQEKRMVQTYNSNNNRLTYEEYDGKNVFLERITETYNPQNDPKEYIIFIPKERFDKTKDTKNVTKYWYKYDKNGNWTERVSYKNGEEYSSDEVKRTISYY